MSWASSVCRLRNVDEINMALAQKRGARGALRPDAEASDT